MIRGFQEYRARMQNSKVREGRNLGLPDYSRIGEASGQGKRIQSEGPARRYQQLAALEAGLEKENEDMENDIYGVTETIEKRIGELKVTERIEKGIDELKVLERIEVDYEPSRFKVFHQLINALMTAAF